MGDKRLVFSVERLLPGDKGLKILWSIGHFGSPPDGCRAAGPGPPPALLLILAVCPRASLALQMQRPGEYRVRAGAAVRGTRWQLCVLSRLWLWQKHPLPKEAADGMLPPTTWAREGCGYLWAWECSRSYEISPGRPKAPGESGLVSRGSQGLRSPLESRRGSLGAP